MHSPASPELIRRNWKHFGNDRIGIAHISEGKLPIRYQVTATYLR